MLETIKKQNRTENNRNWKKIGGRKRIENKFCGFIRMMRNEIQLLFYASSLGLINFLTEIIDLLSTRNSYARSKPSSKVDLKSVNRIETQ